MATKAPPPPKLDDPKERRLYRSELRKVAIAWRAGALLMLMAAVAAKLWLPAQRMLWLPLAVIGFALAIVAVVKRTQYHRKRMAGQKV